jgi:hypothetical protein
MQKTICIHRNGTRTTWVQKPTSYRWQYLVVGFYTVVEKRKTGSGVVYLFSIVLQKVRPHDRAHQRLKRRLNRYMLVSIFLLVKYFLCIYLIYPRQDVEDGGIWYLFSLVMGNVGMILSATRYDVKIESKMCTKCARIRAACRLHISLIICDK